MEWWRRAVWRSRASSLVAVSLWRVAAAGAAEPPTIDPYRPLVQDAVGTRLVNIATPLTSGRRGLEVLFTHRFSEPVQDGSAHDLWGLDSGADTGIGLTLGITAHLDIEVYRSSFLETWELAAKFEVLRQAERLPFSLAARAGCDVTSARGAADRERPFVQILLGRRFRPGWNLFVAPTFARETPRLRNAFNVPVGATVPLSRGLLLEVEVVPANGEVPGSELAWHLALSKAVGTHIFEFTLGNSRATTVDQIVGSDFAGGFASDDVRLGFNLVRGFAF
jgi:Membrane bound beta barrel domain (DUF5777)